MKSPGSDSVRRHREWWYATALLIIVFGLFLASLRFAQSSHWWSLVRAFSEAATIGALADWFAVVALFKAPLGLDFLTGRLGFIGHVAVLPRSQAEIARRAGDYVGESVLTPATIAESLSEVPMATLISEGVKEKKSDISAIALKGLPKGAQVIGRLAIETFLELAANKLGKDPEVHARTNAELTKRIEAWLAGRPGLVSDKVREQIAGISPEMFVARAQEMIGRELQFIRINGTLVGGAVGLMLYGVASLVGG